VLSFGERLSAMFLKGILLNGGIISEIILPESVGVITDGEYGAASVDFSKSDSNVRKALSGELTYIVPGSYGISRQGRVTLFGLSGSDYLAACLAKCIVAQSVDIWKSSDGFLSADPDIVKNPVQINTLTYNEAAELAYFGTKILHPRSVEPLIDSHIPIRIFNLSKNQDVNKPFSVVNSERVVTSEIVKSVTFSDDFGILKLEGPGVGINPGILAKVTTALYSGGINIISVLTSQISINILLAKRDVPKAHLLIGDIALSAVGDFRAINNISVIVAIGNGLAETCGVAARIYSALASENINVLMSCSGASPIVTYFLVNDEERTRAVRAVHREFFENKQ
jgi:aspartate kinase/aspartokinase/homoserine dehydrogenase 1